MLGRILWAIIVILVVLWVISLVVHITFWAIHLLIVAAIILFVWNLVMSNRRRAL